MSAEIEQPEYFVNPISGEALTLAAPSEDLAGYLVDAREAEIGLRQCKRLVTDELLSRMDKAASWTLNLDGMKASGASPQPAEAWDGAELREALLTLVDEGVLTIEAVDAAVETVVSYKPRKVGINALRKLGGRVAEVVNSLSREVERDRYVTVTRA